MRHLLSFSSLIAVSLFLVTWAHPAVAEPPPGTTTGPVPIKNAGVYWAGPESYSKLKSLGANLVTSNFANDTGVRLYWAGRTGVQLILFNSAWVDDSVAGGRANTSLICSNVGLCKNHPAVWGYYVIDEPSKHVYPTGARNPTSVATMQAVFNTVKRCDPGAQTVAVFLPGGGFGGSNNNFAAGIADKVLFDTYFKAADGVHFEWITDTVLPAAIRVVKQRDPSAEIWAAFQTFAVNSPTSRIGIPTRAEVQRSIDLTVQTHTALNEPLDGALFFLWDSNFDSENSVLTDDLRSHRDYWTLIDYAADRLPAVAGVLPRPAEAGGRREGSASPAGRVTREDASSWRDTAGLVSTQPCSDPTPTGVIEGEITRIAADGTHFIGARTFVVNDATNVLQFTASLARMNQSYIQPGAYVKVFPRDGRTLNAPACKILVKPIFNLKFTVLQVTRRTDLLFDGAVLSVKEGHLEVNTGQEPLPFGSIEVDGDLATSLTFTNPPDTPEMVVTVDNLWRGSLLQVRSGFIGGSASNLRGVDVVVLPNNTGPMDVTGPAVTGRFPVVSRDTPPKRTTRVRLNDVADLYYSGRDASGASVLTPLARASLQPQGIYSFIGGYDDASTSFKATVAYQAAVSFKAIVTDALNGGLTLKLMGPDFLGSETSVITAGLAGATILRQKDDGTMPALAAGSITDFSTVQVTGYWTAGKTFKVTKAVFYYVAPPAPV